MSLNRTFNPCDSCVATNCLAERGTTVSMDFEFTRAGVASEARSNGIQPGTEEFDALIARQTNLTELPEELHDPLEICVTAQLNGDCGNNPLPRVLQVINGD